MAKPKPKTKPKAPPKPTPPSAPASAGIHVSVMLPVGRVKLDPGNLRKHGKRSVDAIARSLKQFGQQKPIVIGADDVLIAGEGQLLAARKLGWTEIWCAKSNLTGAEARAYSVVDNQTGTLSEWLDAELARYLGTVPDPKDLGFDDADLAAHNVALGYASAGDVKPPTVPAGAGGTRLTTAPPEKRRIKAVITADDVSKVERAILATGERNRGRAFVAICEAYLDLNPTDLDTADLES